MEVLWLVMLSSCSSVVDASLVRFPARYKADDTMVTHGGSKVERCRCVEVVFVEVDCASPHHHGCAFSLSSLSSSL